MKPLSEKLKTFSASQFIDWLCLACVDVREVHTPYDAQEEINKIREALTERLSTLQEQLTATTNSLTNAQEALKSAGIEADTVQAGVMELKAQRDAISVLAEERRQFIVNGVETGDITLPVIDADPATVIYERCLLKPMFAHDAYLNAVRAEGADAAAAKIRKAIPAFKDIHCGAVKECAGIAEMVAAQFTTGNPGKDGSHE